MHTAAFRHVAASQHSEDEVRAFIAHVYQPAYSDQMLGENLVGAWVEQELVATAGWCPADDSGGTARIVSLFVRPLFTNLGLGTMLLRNGEARARQGGFFDFAVRASLGCVPFFERLGYETTSFGVRPLAPSVDLRVAFMRRRDGQRSTAERLRGEVVGEGAGLPGSGGVFRKH